MARKSFKGVLGTSGSGGFVIEIPFDVKEVFGSARPPVQATVNGVKWPTTVAVYGGRFYLGIRRDVREKAKIDDGDTLTVVIESDDLPRTVDVPAELKRALRAAPDARNQFEKLSFTHQREYVEWITGAKREETRSRRIVKAIEMLREGQGQG